MTEPPDRLSKVKDALDEARLRRARGELSATEYRELLQDMTVGLSTEQRAELGLTPTPTPRPGQAGSGVKLGPTGGSGRGLRTQLPSLSDITFTAGTVLLDQWEIIRELGRGGFGAVFEARELHLEEVHAVKVLDPGMVAREELLSRFRREVQLMRKLVHPRIVRVFDYREDLSQHLALLSMEFIRGCDVREIVGMARKRGMAVPIALVQNIFAQTLEALAEAHRQGVIHRDVTAGNILLAGGSADHLLTHPGSDPQAKLVDFGIAGLVERSELSQKSRVLGTAAYVAPEVLDPNAEVTPAADVYGAGAVAYELLTGKTPLVTGYKPVSAIRRDAPPGLASAVMSAIAADPSERPSAATVGAMLSSPAKTLSHDTRAAKGTQEEPSARSQSQLDLLRGALSEAIKEQNRDQVRERLKELIALLGPVARQDEFVRVAERWVVHWDEEDVKTEAARLRHEAAEAREVEAGRAEDGLAGGWNLQDGVISVAPNPARHDASAGSDDKRSGIAHSFAEEIASSPSRRLSKKTAGMLIAIAAVGLAGLLTIAFLLKGRPPQPAVNEQARKRLLQQLVDSQVPRALEEKDAQLSAEIEADKTRTEELRKQLGKQNRATPGGRQVSVQDQQPVRSELAAAEARQKSLEDEVRRVKQAQQERTGLRTDETGMSNVIPTSAGGAIYHFDEGSGVTAIDSSGAGNNAVIEGPTYVAGHSGTALRFAGPYQRVLLPPTLFKEPTVRTFYFEAWVRPDGTQPPNCGQQTIFRKRSDWNDWEVWMNSSQGNQLIGNLYDLQPGGGISLQGGSLPANQWSKVALWYDGAVARLYLNGVVVSQEAKVMTLNWSTKYLRAEIGNDTADAGVNCTERSFHGDIDEVVIATTKPGQ